MVSERYESASTSPTTSLPINSHKPETKQRKTCCGPDRLDCIYIRHLFAPSERIDAAGLSRFQKTSSRGVLSYDQLLPIQTSSKKQKELQLADFKVNHTKFYIRCIYLQCFDCT